MKKSKIEKTPWIFISVLCVLALVGGMAVYLNKVSVKPDSDKLLSEVSYKCSGAKQIKASYYEGPVVTVAPGDPPKPTGSVSLVLSDGRSMTLDQTMSGSGIRYANYDESMVFWSKGDTAFVTENNTETYSNCIQY